VIAAGRLRYGGSIPATGRPMHRHDTAFRLPRALARLATVAAPIAFAAFLAGTAQGSGDVAKAGLARRPPARPVSTHGIRAGETLDDLLARGGLAALERRRFVDLMRPHTDWRAPRADVRARFHAWPGEDPVRVELEIDADRTLDFRLAGAVWGVAVDSVPVRPDTVVVSGHVQSSLYGSVLEGDAHRLSVAEKADLGARLAGVFAWQIDFFRDPRPGDAFRISLERDVRPDGSIRGARVLGAEYRRGGEMLGAYRFEPSDEPGALYFDGEGRALRGAFLRAPLDLVRVTSRFSSARFHPVLGRYRSHAGIDYGAPSGTVVRATGDGRIAEAGWAGEYGLMVEITHGRGIRTRYAHLSGVADGVRPGTEVAQGTAIGAVGSTGLSTAPHLHYEFLLDGRAVDPSSVDLPVERPIADADTARFARERAAAGRLLDRVAWPGVLVAARPAPAPDRSGSTP